MTQTYVYDGSTLSNVKRDSVRLTEQANMGTVGSGSFTIEDDAGSVEIVGHKSFKAEQSSCSVATMFRGHVVDRECSRGETEMVGAGREITVNVIDGNVRAGFKVIRGLSWKRPTETISTRLTALLASSFLSGLVADTGYVTSSSISLDKADLRGQRPGDVIADMAERAKFNWFIFWDEAADSGAGAYSLFFGDSNTQTSLSSTLRISNVMADVDSTTTFAPSQDTKLSRSPERVVSGIWLPFAKGNVYRTRATTETEFQPRDGTAPNANVKRRAKAVTLADDYLFEHRNEEDQITTRLRLPATKVNLARAGYRIQGKFSHFEPEGYADDFRWFSIVERTVSQPQNDDNTYDVDMTLSPQESNTCGAIVQSSGNISSPATATLSSPVTPGNVLVAIGFRNGDSAMPPIEYLGVDAGFTALGSPLQSTGLDGGSEGRCFAQAKLVTTGTPSGAYGFSDGAGYEWRLYEVAADFNSRTVLTQAQGTAPLTSSATLDLGSFSGASGVALMVQAIGKQTGHGACVESGSEPFDAIDMGSWTERFEGGMPAGAMRVGIGDATGVAPDPSWAWGICPDGDIGTWSGLAVLFSC